MFTTLENLFLRFLLLFFSADSLNSLLGNPAFVALTVGGLIAVSGGLLGTFLVLRQLSLVSDAISHTVLLGIVVAFLVMTFGLGMDVDLSSEWLLVGATLAGVGTVALTEMIFRSGLVAEDAALGLVFPFLFAVGIILTSRYADDIHLDSDAVLVGEIGIAWANTRTHCFENCASFTLTPDHPKAERGRICVNCAAENISPRSPEAIFEETCSNCGVYSPAQAWQAGLIASPPRLVFFPKALTVVAVIAFINLLFVGLLYKELKLAAFDSALAQALGFRPALLSYGLMLLVSLTAVGAFDAVGAILSVAFFIIPPATAYLWAKRLSVMLGLSVLLGGAGVVLGYGLAQVDTSISAAMVVAMFGLFALSWLISPRQGLLSAWYRKRRGKKQGLLLP
jgi:manganese/zinc/iron transport system permease protein